MKILVLNSGSSSVKYRLFDKSHLRVVVAGAVEEIGEGKESRIAHKVYGDEGKVRSEHSTECEIKDHEEAIETVLALLLRPEKLQDDKCDMGGEDVQSVLKDKSEIWAVGHRVVHGGEHFRGPAVVDDDVMETIEQLEELAPLHNEPNVKGIAAINKSLGRDVKQVVVFDTAFHHTIPPCAFMYALPYEVYEKKRIRKYGFHGTSHCYVAKRAADFLGGKLSDFKFVSLHLGNGCSACAIDRGKSVDTSMGLTPLEGLMMGTRCGDVDPSVIAYLVDDKARIDGHRVDEILNKESGLKGICGTNDMRDIKQALFSPSSSSSISAGEEDSARERARLAFDMFCYRIKKYIGAYYAMLGGADAILFTAGIGEHSAEVRQAACRGLECIGVRVDENKNASSDKADRDVLDITRYDGDDEGDKATKRTRVLVVPTDEEREIASQMMSLLDGNEP